jgi:hypothetical protein
MLGDTLSVLCLQTCGKCQHNAARGGHLAAQQAVLGCSIGSITGLHQAVMAGDSTPGTPSSKTALIASRSVLAYY